MFSQFLAKRRLREGRGLQIRVHIVLYLGPQALEIEQLHSRESIIHQLLKQEQKLPFAGQPFNPIWQMQIWPQNSKESKCTFNGNFYQMSIQYKYPYQLIELMNTWSVNGQEALRSKDYRCPCGKSYTTLSAISTHIRSKHDGKAPGQICRPQKLAKRRGRPPVVPQRDQWCNYRAISQCVDSLELTNQQNDIEEKKQKKIESANPYCEGFKNLFKHLSVIETPQQINPKIWEQVETFRLMEDFIDSKHSPEPHNESICLGMGLSEFLKDVSASLTGKTWQFEQVLVLFVLLLQYLIDENNKSSIITDVPLQQLVEVMNPFIKGYSHFLQIDNLWIMKQRNMALVFVCFYNWMKWKNYTKYCITLI